MSVIFTDFGLQGTFMHVSLAAVQNPAFALTLAMQNLNSTIIPPNQLSRRSTSANHCVG